MQLRLRSTHLSNDHTSSQNIRRHVQTGNQVLFTEMGASFPNICISNPVNSTFILQNASVHTGALQYKCWKKGCSHTGMKWQVNTGMWNNSDYVSVPFRELHYFQWETCMWSATWLWYSALIGIIVKTCDYCWNDWNDKMLELRFDVIVFPNITWLSKKQNALQQALISPLWDKERKSFTS